MSNHSNVIEKEDVVIKFVGDSGDGMQLAGTLFSDAAALQGLDLATFPDYPAEIRAPQNTIAGVSGFQVRVGTKKIDTTGDQVDILVAMNPASLKSNLKWTHPGATLIVDADAFDEASVKKSGYSANPLEDDSLSGYNVVKAPVSSLTRAALKELGIDNKSADRTRNMFALGICYHIFNWKLSYTIDYFKTKFKKKPEMIEANKIVLEAGYSYADNVEALASKYHITKAKMQPGRYRNITGNVATAWGLLAASERSGRPLFLGSYPITPATEILIELAKHKSLGAKVFQAEDEIAGICSAIAPV